MDPKTVNVGLIVVFLIATALLATIGYRQNRKKLLVLSTATSLLLGLLMAYGFQIYSFSKLFN